MTIEWDRLGLCTRYAILGTAQLPANLAFCQWQQLTQGERDALYFVDWFKVIEYVSKDNTR